MAETLTYDQAEAQPGQLSEEEMDSLQLGEEMINQQENLLAGKYANAQELERAYVELESKLGQQRTTESEQEVETQEEQPEVEDVDYSFLETLWEEAQGEFKPETLDTLSKMDPGDLAKMYLEERSQRSTASDEPVEIDPEMASDLKDLVGGDEEYNSMLGWAKQNLNQDEIEMYDTAMNQGNPLTCYFAIQALAARYFDSDGQEGELLTGKAAYAGDGDVFRSQAELVSAMGDERYELDPAYRQDVIDKLERSELDF